MCRGNLGHSQVRMHRITITRIAFLTGLVLAGALPVSFGAEIPPPPEEPSPLAAFLAGVDSHTSAAGVAFLTQKTRLWLGRSQVICFYSKATTDEDRFFTFDADENFLHVLIPPTLTPGTHLGYVRVRPLKEGRTQLKLAGTTLDVEIVKDTAAATLEASRPEIVTPVAGSVVWGKFVVGVERLNLSTSAAPPAPVLRLPDGREIESQIVPNQQPGPHLRYAFTVDAESLAPGLNQLVAVLKTEPGHEAASEPVEVVRLDPTPAEVMSGDCKDQLKTHWPTPKIPFAYPSGEFEKLKPPAVVADDRKTFGSVVSMSGENPAWAIPVTVPEKCVCQLIVTARGDIGGNALPTVALFIDGSGNAATTARLATTDWQRLPVGHPITLEAGDHVLSVHFRNGFSSGSTDQRRLYLAGYELAHLNHTASPVLATASAGGPMMQAVPAMASAPAGGSMMATAAMQEAAPMSPKPTGGSMMASSMMEKSAAAPSVAGLAQPGSFHLAFRDALDGQVIANQVQVNGVGWWPDRDHSRPPSVDLLVNDQVIATQTTGRPHFRVDLAAFHPGENKLQLQGLLPSGARAQSVTESIILPPGLSAGNEPYRPSYRFYVYDPAWGDTMMPRINPDQPDPMGGFYTNGDATLRLPEALQGNWKISIEARGDDFNGPAVASVFLESNGRETKLADVPAGAKLGVLTVAKTQFARGPKSLIVRFANDAWEKDKGDRNLYVHSVQLDPIPAQPVKIAPTAVVAYPSAGARIGLADAVVVNVTGHSGGVHADLLVDGKPQHFNLQATNGLGPILVPLLTRSFAPGEHHLQIAVRDDAGNSGTSSPMKVIFTGKDDDSASSYARAVLLLNRFGYGPEPRELAAILTMGPHAWLEARLNETIQSPAEQNEQVRLHAEFPDSYSTVPRAVQYLVTDNNPVRARFVMWAENHFSTWISKDEPPEKSREHDRFVELGAAPFPDLLLVSATSPAMLIYLDQRYSVGGHLNENYAREIMELHTLGVKGGYTQKDVTTLADLLTGWTLADEAPLDGGENLVRTFRYNPYLNSGSACRVLGMEFPGVPLDHRFDRVLTALNMLSSHPSCAFFISRKLAEHYVADPAPPELVNNLARVYLESGGDVRAMLVAMTDDPAFWTVPAKVASPVDFSVRLARLARLNNPGPVNDLLSHSGMGMFDRVTPDGYPDADGYFTSSNALLQRWHYAQAIQSTFLTNGLIPDDMKPTDQQWDPVTTQRLLDLAAMRITGGVLGNDSNDAALKLLAAAPANTDGRLHLLATFLCQVPETSLR